MLKFANMGLMDDTIVYRYIYVTCPVFNSLLGLLSSEKSDIKNTLVFGFDTRVA